MKRASFAMAAATLLGSTLGSSGLRAQESPRDWTRFVPRVSMAGAFDARNNGRSDPEMYLGLMSLEWDTRVPRLSLRVDGIYAKRDWATRLARNCAGRGSVDVDCILPGGATHSFFASKVGAAGGMIGVTYDLRERSAFRPYILTGAGMVRSHDNNVAGRFTPIAPCPTAECIIAAVGQPATQRNERPLTAAAQIGGGMALSLPWVSVFAEARYYAVGYSNTRVLRGAVPVSLGLRF